MENLKKDKNKNKNFTVYTFENIENNLKIITEDIQNYIKNRLTKVNVLNDQEKNLKTLMEHLQNYTRGYTKEVLEENINTLDLPSRFEIYKSVFDIDSNKNDEAVEHYISSFYKPQHNTKKDTKESTTTKSDTDPSLS